MTKRYIAAFDILRIVPKGSIRRGLRAVKRAGARADVLVVHYLRQQYNERVERELQQWQREQQQ